MRAEDDAMTQFDPVPLQMFARGDGVRLAYRLRDGRGPIIVFLPGYMSDMEGGKAVAVDQWAAREQRPNLGPQTATTLQRASDSPCRRVVSSTSRAPPSAASGTSGPP